MMLLSRFWYVVLSLLLGATLVSLYMAQSMYNRAGEKVLAEGLSSDSQVVSWYIRNASRERSGQLITFALNPKLAKALAESSAKQDSVPRKARDAATSEVQKLAAKVPAEFGFDAATAVATVPATNVAVLARMARAARRRMAVPPGARRHVPSR